MSKMTFSAKKIVKMLTEAYQRGYAEAVKVQFLPVTFSGECEENGAADYQVGGDSDEANRIIEEEQQHRWLNEWVITLTEDSNLDEVFLGHHSKDVIISAIAMLREADYNVGAVKQSSYNHTSFLVKHKEERWNNTTGGFIPDSERFFANISSFIAKQAEYRARRATWVDEQADDRFNVVEVLKDGIVHRFTYSADGTKHERYDEDTQLWIS